MSRITTDRWLERSIAIAGLVLVVAVGQAHAQPADPEGAAPPEPEATEPPADSADIPDQPDDADSQLVIVQDSVEQTEIEALRDDVQMLQQELEQAREMQARSRSRVSLVGYIDFGFFAMPDGNGSGVRRDAGHMIFPKHDDFGWVFYGDIFAPTVNTRGDVADLDESSVGVEERANSIDSNGHPTFLVNEVSFGARVGVTDNLLAMSSVNFTPRKGNEFNFGDNFDLDIAQVEWMPTRSQNHSIFVGKVIGVLGAEYKRRKSNERFGITPSLIQRYTSGTALGVKARSKLFNDWVILAGSVTNGSFGTEFFHFNDEIDSNNFKTLAARVATRLPIGEKLEIGISGQTGTSDRMLDGQGDMLLYAADAEFAYGPIVVHGEALLGEIEGCDARAGRDCGADERAYNLKLNAGWYLEVDYLLSSWIGLIARGDLRNARVWLDDERLYITKSWRATGGLRFIFNAMTALKVEYLYNREYGEVPQIPNDVVTTSLVVDY